MPANIPTEAAKALEDSRSVKDPQDKIKKIQEAISLMPKHKGTEKFIGNLKRRISKLKDEVEKREKMQKAGRKGISKQGAAQVCLVGKENSGKTFLLNKLTGKGADSTPAPFETQEPVVGMHEHEGVKIQVLDLPSITPDFYLRSDGPYVMNLVRTTDLVVLTFKDGEPVDEQLSFLKREFAQNKMMFNEEKPRVRIKKTGRGGIDFIGEQYLEGRVKDYKKLLQKHKYTSAIVEVFTPTTLQDFKRVLNNYAYKKTLMLEDFDGAGEKIWSALGLIKVYTKQPGKDKTPEPLALEEGSTVEDVAFKIHKDFVKKFRFARVWGRSADFPGQRVGLTHELRDEDTVQFHVE